jgi:hypothetical protein
MQERRLIRWLLVGAFAVLPTVATAAPKPAAARKPAARPAAPPRLPEGVISLGEEVSLAARRTPEKATVFVFLKPGSSLERQFLEELRAGARGVDVKAIHLTTGSEPVARQYEVTETPTAVVMDRHAKVRARSSDAGEIRKAVQAAALTMRIGWAEEGDPRYAESVRVLGRPPGNGILRTMTLRPDYLDHINKLSRVAHFQDQYLTRRTKEVIASYVSALNKCKY